jgi:hypothetical protein
MLLRRLPRGGEKPDSLEHGPEVQGAKLAVS